MRKLKTWEEVKEENKRRLERIALKNKLEEKGVTCYIGTDIFDMLPFSTCSEDMKIATAQGNRKENED